jgi:acyl-CoA synthetase (AMP-forming)/AMP-acid ligase II
MDRTIEHLSRGRGDRAAPLLRALIAGVKPGDRVATMAMDSGRHLECWYGIMGIGAVCHTLNPRLFNADLEYIVNRAADYVVFVDPSLATKLAAILAACPSVRHAVTIGGATPFANHPNKDIFSHDYDALVAAHRPAERSGQFPEEQSQAFVSHSSD